VAHTTFFLSGSDDVDIGQLAALPAPLRQDRPPHALNQVAEWDPESGRVEQFGYDFDNGLRYRKATAFNRIGGVLFSDQENYAVDGGKIPVDTLSEDYVESEMRLLSTVTISNVDVEPL